MARRACHNGMSFDGRQESQVRTCKSWGSRMDKRGLDDVEADKVLEHCVSGSPQSSTRIMTMLGRVASASPSTACDVVEAFGMGGSS